MPKEFSRSQRMAEQIRRELAELVRDELKDPRVKWVSFTAVKVSRDLSSAVVYFSVLNDEDIEDTTAAMNSATGFLRHELGRRIRSRIVPALKFIHDDSIQRGSSMDALIAKARASDPEPEDE
ncbi:MAG: 30S ribosome-binding factor RbfA [Gammaproteobacteria bacterium]|nr:30S ribosome-binding factor RbfA [Gammaproteobacteria bacterium]